MADLIELNIVVKDNGIKQAVTTVSRLERELTKAVKAFDAGTLSQKRLNEVILSAKKQYKDYAGNAGLAAINVNKFVKEQKAATIATKEAKAAAEADALAKKKQIQNVREMQAALAAQKKAQEDNTASLNRMRAAYDSTFAAEQKTLKLKALLRQEIANGNMTVRQAGAELLKYRQSLIAHNEATMAATKGNNRFGVVTQQAGYQVGDFLVQIQSGTNPLVAFGQQATQLVGILPLLGAGFMGLSAGALVALSAGLGIAIPLVTAIGAAFMRTRGEAEEATPAIERMAAALDELDSFSLSSFRSMKDGLQGVNEAVLVTLDLFEQLSQRQLLVASVEFLAGLDVFEQIQEAEKAITANRGRGRARGGEDPFALGLSIEKAREFRDLLYSISGTTREEMANSFAEVVAQMERGGLLTEETTQIIQQMGQELGLVKALQDGVRESAEATAQATDQQNTAINNTKAKLEDILASLRERQALAQAYLNNGEEGVRQEERLLYRQNLINELLSDRGMLTNEQLGLLLETINETFRLEDAVERAKVQLEQSNAAADNLAESLKEAASAMQQMISFGQNLDTKIAQAAAKVQALQKGTNAANAAMIVGLREEAAQRRLTAAASAVGADQLRAINAEYDAQIDKIDELEGLVEQADALTEAQKGVSKATKTVTDDFDRLRQELEGPMVNAVSSISDAFGNFIARGMTDFKGFVRQILASFQNMIAQMIAMAVKNRIMLSLGIGGITPAMAAAGQVAGIGGASTMLGSIGAGAGFAGIAGGTGFLGGAANAISGIAGGGAGFFNVAGNAAMAGGGALATIGAAIPVIGAVAAAFSFFRKKTTELDNGLRVTVNNMDTLVETFKTLETKRFWGLSKRVTTSFEEASSEVSGPLEASIQSIQRTVLQAAKVLNIGAESFEDFSYDFSVSLKGLSEEQKKAKVSEELIKLGDAFAQLGDVGSLANADSILRGIEANKKFLEELRRNDPIGYLVERIKGVWTTLEGGLKDFVTSAEELGFLVGSYLKKAFDGFADSIGGGGPLSGILKIQSRMEELFKPLEEGMDLYYKRLESFETRAELEGRKIGYQEDPFRQVVMARGFMNRAVKTVTDFYVAGVAEPLKTFFPKEAEKISDEVKAMLSTVSEGNTQAFESVTAFLTQRLLTEWEYGNYRLQKELMDEQQAAFKILEQVYKGEISLTEEYTSKQQAAIDKMRETFDKLKSGLESVLDTLDAGLKTLAGTREEIAQQTMSRDAALRYLRNVANTGSFSLTGDNQEFSSAVSTVSNVGSSGFATAVEMLRYIGQTSGLLNDIRSQAEQQLTDAQIQVEALLKIKETNQTSSEALVSIEQSMKDFLAAGGRIPAFANGGYHSGGLRLVGENGPEIEATGPARIISNKELSIGDMSGLKQEVQNLRQDLNNALTQIAKNTRKSADTLNKFDYQGLPLDRGY